ncbi:MAG: N-acetylglucosamine-6-phosphate deacetylase [Clostridia bacterium]|nr:N-acetylglucosamine-6-phosphate deacetylase [Clostridia bacterium]
MKLINAKILGSDFKFFKGGIEISDDKKIVNVCENLAYSDDELVVDCDGFTIVPGFIDIHIHGSVGRDTCDGTRESLSEMAEYLLSNGITSFCPTTMTVDVDTIKNALAVAKDCMDNPPDGAAILGVNMEGPFISPAKKGAQNEKFVIKPDIDLFKSLQKEYDGIVKLVDIAPEEDENMKFVCEAKELATLSIAHTSTDYDTAKASFDAGITHATHLFNAMTGFNHREPGVVGAVFEDERVYAELICDGKHVHPSVVKTVFNLMGDRICVISDALMLSGMPEGTEGELGKLPVRIREGRCELEDGTIAGSISNLHEELINLVSWGIPLEKAVKAMTINPARQVGCDDIVGSIEKGKRADLVILDDDLNIVGVYH